MRRTELRERFGLKVDRCLAVSRAVARTLEGAGFDPAQMSVLRQAMPEDTDTWERLGRDRVPGRQGETLVVGFVGSAYPHKGPQLLVEAAQSARLPDRGADPRRDPARLRPPPAGRSTPAAWCA